MHLCLVTCDWFVCEYQNNYPHEYFLFSSYIFYTRFHCSFSRSTGSVSLPRLRHTFRRCVIECMFPTAWEPDPCTVFYAVLYIVKPNILNVSHLIRSVATLPGWELLTVGIPWHRMEERKNEIHRVRINPKCLNAVESTGKCHRHSHGIMDITRRLDSQVYTYVMHIFGRLWVLRCWLRPCGCQPRWIWT